MRKRSTLRMLGHVGDSHAPSTLALRLAIGFPARTINVRTANMMPSERALIDESPRTAAGALSLTDSMGRSQPAGVTTIFTRSRFCARANFAVWSPLRSEETRRATR